MTSARERISLNRFFNPKRSRWQHQRNLRWGASACPGRHPSSRAGLCASLRRYLVAATQRGPLSWWTIPIEMHGLLTRAASGYTRHDAPGGQRILHGVGLRGVSSSDPKKEWVTHRKVCDGGLSNSFP
jgi:hypothetical protein